MKIQTAYMSGTLRNWLLAGGAVVLIVLGSSCLLNTESKAGIKSNNVVDAEGFCQKPGVYDQSCIANAIKQRAPAFSVRVPAHAYEIYSTLTIPSNAIIYWDGSTLRAAKDLNDDVLLVKGENVSMAGHLIVDGSQKFQSHCPTGNCEGVEIYASANVALPTLEIRNTFNQCLQIRDSSSIRAAQVTLTNCGYGMGGGDGFFIWAHGRDTSDVTLDHIRVDGTVKQNCGYLSGDSGYLVQHVVLGILDLRNCADEGLEIGGSSHIVVKSISVRDVRSVGVLLRGSGNGDSDITLGQVSCLGGEVCLDIANYEKTDALISGVVVNSVTADRVALDGLNFAPVRISNASRSSAIEHVVIRRALATNSKTFFRCVGSPGGPVRDVRVERLSSSQASDSAIHDGYCTGLRVLTIR